MSQPSQLQQYPLPVQSTETSKSMCVDLVHASKHNSQDSAASATATELQLSQSQHQLQPSVTKEQLKDYLRQWVRVENEISMLSAERKKRKLIHQQLSTSLLEVMRKNEIDCFDIANGRIVYSKTKIRAPLNNGQIKTALKNYYKDDIEKANSLTEFLLASRVEKTRESIKMKIQKIK